MGTYFATKQTVTHQWYLVDASDQILGRLAKSLAKYLCGKHKPTYTPHVDVGDYVIVINAEKIKVTGNKQEQKIYYSHSGYPGGLKKQSFKQLREKHPTRLIEKAVKGMLPKTSLGHAMLRKLKVYAGTQHLHIAQQPIVIDFNDTAFDDKVN